MVIYLNRQFKSSCFINVTKKIKVKYLFLDDYVVDLKVQNTRAQHTLGTIQ